MNRRILKKTGYLLLWRSARTAYLYLSIKVVYDEFNYI